MELTFDGMKMIIYPDDTRIQLPRGRVYGSSYFKGMRATSKEAIVLSVSDTQS